MEFRLTDDQRELQALVRVFCEANYSDLAVLEVAPLAAWDRLAALDVFRVAQPVADNGLGLGLVDAAAVFEMLGEHLVPGPVVWSALAARHVPSLSTGEGTVSGGESVAAGLLVPWAAESSALVSVDHDGVFALDAQYMSVEPTDPLTRVARVTAVRGRERLGDAAMAAELRRNGSLLTATLLVGLAQRAVAAAVAYASERHQFGRPIGSFQALKHLIADCYVRASLARSAVYAAAAMADDPVAGDATRAVAAAKLLAADAAIRNARTCIQVHGGMGFTWEMIPHYLLKRAWVHENAFGTRTEHCEARASALERELIA